MKKPRNRVYPTGKDHPRWLGGEREKVCQFCGKTYAIRPKQPITSFKRSKFCSKSCADKGGFRYSGEQHPNYREDARRKNRGGLHQKWADAVISRDGAKCRHCGADDLELHAHHIKSFQDYPDLRFDIDNGLTLCFRCHLALHAALKAKSVNSGNIPPGQAEDNPEPSIWGNPVEGVTTRGRAFRRWVGKCSWCDAAISKTWSDTVGKEALFCGMSCRSKWIRAKVKRAKAVISSTNALPERDDIV